MNDSDAPRSGIECPLLSISTAIDFTPHDWSTHHRLTWIYGIACGWDEDSLAEAAVEYSWEPETVKWLKRLRAKWEFLEAAPKSVVFDGSVSVGDRPEDELADDDPLWCVNEQIKDLLLGYGANEDHECVIQFFRKTGLPEGTVARIHKAIVCAENSPPNAEVSHGANNQKS
jgi:hypothetical protein